MYRGISHFFPEHWVEILCQVDDEDVIITPRDQFTDPPEKPFSKYRIAFDFEIRKYNKDPGVEQVDIPVSLKIYIHEGDFAEGVDPKKLDFKTLKQEFEKIAVADYDPHNKVWHRLRNLSHWLFKEAVSFNSKTYYGFIIVDTCFSGDPPIAVGT